MPGEMKKTHRKHVFLSSGRGMILHESVSLVRSNFFIYEVWRLKQWHFRVFKNVILQSLVSGVKIEIYRDCGSVGKWSLLVFCSFVCLH